MAATHRSSVLWVNLIPRAHQTLLPKTECTETQYTFCTNMHWPPLTWCFRYSTWGSPNMLTICITTNTTISSCTFIQHSHSAVTSGFIQIWQWHWILLSISNTAIINVTRSDHGLIPQSHQLSLPPSTGGKPECTSPVFHSFPSEVHSFAQT